MAGALADHALHLCEVPRSDRRADHQSLLVVLGRIHADEARPFHPFRRVVDPDAAEIVGGGEHLMVHLDLHHVAVFGDRPIRPVRAVRRVMHRILAAQPLEIRIPRVVVVELRVADIDLVEGQRISLVAHCIIHVGIHRVPPFRPQAAFNAGPPACGRRVRRALPTL